MNIELIEKIAEKYGAEYIRNEKLAKYTSFEIGGCCDILVKPNSVDCLKDILKICRDNGINYYILGRGSNVLISDKGLKGAVILLSSDFSEIRQPDDCRIICAAGASLTKVCAFARDNSLTGLEFAYGIPGSLGGAVYMNAGAYGGEISGAVLSAECMTADGSTVKVEAKDMNFGYRKSVFKENGTTVISAVLSLQKGEKKEIEEKMEDYISRRKSKQPLEYPSAGSFFKRPEGYFAGALIEKNGLKGATEGGAQVSCKHAGFIINRGGATAADVMKLSRKVSDTVLAKDGVSLEREVIFIGREEKGE